MRQYEGSRFAADTHTPSRRRERVDQQLAVGAFRRHAALLVPAHLRLEALWRARSTGVAFDLPGLELVLGVEARRPGRIPIFGHCREVHRREDTGGELLVVEQGSLGNALDGDKGLLGGRARAA